MTIKYKIGEKIELLNSFVLYDEVSSYKKKKENVIEN